MAISLPFDSHTKLKINPVAEIRHRLRGPPSIGCRQIFETPSRVSTKLIASEAGAQRMTDGSRRAGVGNLEYPYRLSSVYGNDPEAVTVRVIEHVRDPLTVGRTLRENGGKVRQVVPADLPSPGRAKANSAFPAPEN